jgi:hypothetical protein
LTRDGGRWPISRPGWKNDQRRRADLIREDIELKISFLFFGDRHAES